MTENSEDSDRITDEAAETVVVVGDDTINGVHPPMIKPPPEMRVPVVDNNTCSTWDLLKELFQVREGEEGPFDDEYEVSGKEGEEVGRVSPKREEEEGMVDNAARGAEIVTNDEGDSSSTATEPRS